MSGNGRNPVVGVRPLDAEAFCNWLTERDGSGWRFRLPRANELNLSRLRNDGHVLEMEQATYWFVTEGGFRMATPQAEQDVESLLKTFKHRFEKDWDLYDLGRYQAYQAQVSKLALKRAQKRRFALKNLDRPLESELNNFPEIIVDLNHVRDRGLNDIATDLDMGLEESINVINDPSLLAARQVNLETIIELAQLFRKDVKRAKNLKAARKYAP